MSKFIFLGGSHNFGQALDFNDTVQGNLQKHLSLNFSTPGYGFNHSFWRVVTDEDLLKKNCLDKKTDEIIFIYRYMFMNGHLMRNMGHSYNKNGPDFRNHKISIYKNLINNKNFILSYCSNFYSCLSYHSQYALYRIISVFRYSDTLIAKNFGIYIEKKLYFTEKSINHTIDVLKLFKVYLNLIIQKIS